MRVLIPSNEGYPCFIATIEKVCVCVRCASTWKAGDVMTTTDIVWPQVHLASPLSAKIRLDGITSPPQKKNKINNNKSNKPLANNEITKT